MAGGRSRTFRPHWALQYALAVAERDPETGQPTKAACLMCRVFTRDETEGSRRRKRKTKVQCFSQPWRPDNMRRHLEQQHKLRWAQYKELSDEDKRGFFPANAAISRQPHVDPVEITPETNAVLPVVELNAAVAAAVKKSGTFLVDKDIVDELLRPLGPDGDEFLGFEMQRIEIDSDDEDLELDVDENDARYVVTVESRLELETCITFMAGGVSFRQAAQLFRGMVGGIAGLDQTNRAMTEKRVKNLCRVACAVNLQRLKDLLESGKVWSFAVVLEWCKTAGSPFLDVRVQFEHEGEIHSVHLVGIVVQDVDFAEESGDLVVRYLDVVAPRWKAKLVGISCVDEGGSKVRACTQEIINRLAAECDSPIFGDCRLASNLNQLMNEACRTVFTAEFTSTLVALMSHLRRHAVHIPDVLYCPKLIEGSWKAALKSLQWLVANQTPVIQFIEKHEYIGAPGPDWWVIAVVVTNVASRVNNVLRQVRAGKGLSHDCQHIVDLMNHLSMMTGAVGPFLASEFFSVSCEDIVIGSFAINPVATATFLKAHGTFANSAVDSVPAETYQALVDVTSTFVLTVLTKLNHIITECKDETDEEDGHSTLNHVPPFLPNALCNTRHQDFVKAMQHQRVRLEKIFSSEGIDKVEAQHRALRNAYLLENRVREEIDMQSNASSFSEVWQEGICAGLDYRALRSFCGALAAVASTGTGRSADAEFSLVNWHKVPFSQSLTDLSLEAILHAQDYRFLACFWKCLDER